MDAIYEFDAERFRLGPLCKRNHAWNGQKKSLRYLSSRSCVECDKSKSKLQSKAGKHAEANAKRRQPNGRPSRAKGANGEVLPVGIGRGLAGFAVLARGLAADDLALAVNEHKALWAAIRQAGKLPSVARLVLLEQRQHWQENPDDYLQFQREKQRQYDQWKRISDPAYRLYHRQKSRRRKALERGSIGIQFKGKQIAKRFEEFGNRCAYCGGKGATGRWQGLQADHVIPISKGGTHVLSNVVPACRACNFSKREKDAETWYRAQPFFCEKRWRKILRVLGVRRGPATQLALL